MTRKQAKQALQRERDRKQAARATRLVVHDYPYSHNPYVPHAPLPDCYPGCKRTVEG